MDASRLKKTMSCLEAMQSFQNRAISEQRAQTDRCNKRNETLDLHFEKQLSAPLTKQQTFTFFKEYNEGQLISFWDKKGHSSMLIVFREPQLYWR